MSGEGPNGDYMVTLTRGQYGHESVLVRGDIRAWLVDRKARPTRDPQRYVIRGWSAYVQPLAAGIVERVGAIVGRDYSAWGR